MRSPFAPPVDEGGEHEQSLFDHGFACAAMMKAAGTPVSTYSLGGRLKLSKSGWILLDVPNALVHGLFAALQEPGVEEPPAREAFYSAHISVMDKGEVDGVGSDISERGKIFHYQLGPVQTVEPAGWKEMSKVYFVQVKSPELQALRKSYGLTPLLNGHEFHITIGVRQKNVLRANNVRKAAEAVPAVSDIEADRSLRQGQEPAERFQSDVADAGTVRGDDGPGGRLAGLLSGVKFAADPRDRDHDGYVLDGTKQQRAVATKTKSKPPASSSLLSELAVPGGVAAALLLLSAARARGGIGKIEPDVGKSLEGEISHYYDKAPGGFEGAAGRAIANQSPVPGTSPLAFDRGDLSKPFGVDEFHPALESDEGGTLPPGMAGNTDPVIVTGGPARGKALEHELSHAALDVTPAARGAQPHEYSQYNGRSRSQFQDYVSSPAELIPRVADIKRQFVEAHPGRDVSTEADAEEALKWYGDTIRRGLKWPGGDEVPGQNTGHVQGWQSWDLDNNSRLRDRVRKLMIQVVDAGGHASTAKVAEKRGPEGEYCPHCDARLERDPHSGTCNRCGRKHAEKKSESTHTRDGRTFDIDKLIESLKGRTPSTIPLSSLPRVNRSSNTGFSPRRLAASDTSFPGIVDHDNNIIDGKHRTTKLRNSGAAEGLYHRIGRDELDAVEIKSAAGTDLALTRWGLGG